jgi:hypothetical protein
LHYLHEDRKPYTLPLIRTHNEEADTLMRWKYVANCIHGYIGIIQGAPEKRGNFQISTLTSISSTQAKIYLHIYRNENITGKIATLGYILKAQWHLRIGRLMAFWAQ